LSLPEAFLDCSEGACADWFGAAGCDESAGACEESLAQLLKSKTLASKKQIIPDFLFILIHLY